MGTREDVDIVESFILSVILITIGYLASFVNNVMTKLNIVNLILTYEISLLIKTEI